MLDNLQSRPVLIVVRVVVGCTHFLDIVRLSRIQADLGEIRRRYTFGDPLRCEAQQGMNIESCLDVVTSAKKRWVEDVRRNLYIRPTGIHEVGDNRVDW